MWWHLCPISFIQTSVQAVVCINGVAVIITNYTSQNQLPMHVSKCILSYVGHLYMGTEFCTGTCYILFNAFIFSKMF
jgi:hypothetical protein